MIHVGIPNKKFTPPVGIAKHMHTADFEKPIPTGGVEGGGRGGCPGLRKDDLVLQKNCRSGLVGADLV